MKSLLLEAQLAKGINLTCHTDSTSGKSMATRYGLGKKTKHIELRYLYMQELVNAGSLKISKVGTHSNHSDLLTKYLSGETTQKHTATLGIRDPKGHFHFD